METLEDRALLSFVPAVPYNTGSYSQAVVVGNFDAGNTPDLVVANYSSSNVSILLGNSDGTFQAAQNFGTSFGPLSVAVGDFDEDGNTDVVTANLYDVSVLLGNGDGTFQAAQNLGIGTNPLSVAVGDFDDDGNLDLGVSSYLAYGGYYGTYYYGYANVLLGDGQGNFSVNNTTSLSSGYPVGAAVGDVDGDGNADLVTANWDWGTISVLRGDGAGGFSSVNDYYAGYTPRSVAMGDLDGDLDMDLAMANTWGNTVSVMLNDGAGGFGAVQSYTAGAVPYYVGLADFNDDNISDLVTANINGGDISVLIGKGDGTFNVAQHSAAGTAPISVAAGDFDGDGFVDVAVANSISTGTVSLLINAGDFPAADAPSVTIDDVTVTEGNTGTATASFTVHLSRAYTEAVTVNFTTADSSATAADGDYVSRTDSVTFAPGEMTKQIAITVNGDRRGEPNEAFLVQLSGALNAFLLDTQAVGGIVDDEPRITINDASVTEGQRGTKQVTLTVTLSAAYDVPVTVNFATADGSATTADNDYIAAAGTVTFAPGVTTQTITLTIVGGRQREANEYFYVNLSNAANALIADPTGIITILNDDKRRGPKGR